MNEPPNRLLEFLTAPAKPDGDACRSNRRRRTSAKIELAWSDQGNWCKTRARLIDISRAGASLLTRSSPLNGRAARLRFLDGEGSPWIEAKVLGVEPESPSHSRIRLKFDEPCPSFLLRMAVLGFAEPEDDGPAVRQEWIVSMPGAYS